MAGNCDQICKEYIVISGCNSYSVYFPLGLNLVTTLSSVNDFVISLRSFQGGIEWSQYVGCVSPAYTVLRPTRNVTPAFWAYLFKSDSFILVFKSLR